MCTTYRVGLKRALLASKAKSFVEEVTGWLPDCVVTEHCDPGTCTVGADIIVVATNANEPVLLK